MTKDGQTLALWGGVAGAVAVIGITWVMIRGGTLADNHARAKQLAGDQAKAQPIGTKLDQQIAAVLKAAQDQDKALKQATGVLVPALKPEYLAADLTSGANRVATDLKALRQRAERTRVALPGTLPLESGLDPDEAVRLVQLAQLDLYRISLDTIMDAGITRVSTVTAGRAWTDPSSTYALLTAEIDIEGPYEAVQATLQGFLGVHAQGVGLRGVTIIPGSRAESPMRVHLTTSLLTANQPTWKLAAEKPTGSIKAPLKTPAKTPTAGSKPSLGDD